MYDLSHQTNLNGFDLLGALIPLKYNLSCINKGDMERAIDL